MEELLCAGPHDDPALYSSSLRLDWAEMREVSGRGGGGCIPIAHNDSICLFQTTSLNKTNFINLVFFFFPVITDTHLNMFTH